MAWLALTVQLVSVRTQSSLAIPPPRAEPAESTRLALMDEFVSVALPPERLRPPPLEVARLLTTALEATFSVPLLEMPPPVTAELPLTVQPVSVADPV